MDEPVGPDPAPSPAEPVRPQAEASTPTGAPGRARRRARDEASGPTPPLAAVATGAPVPPHRAADPSRGLVIAGAIVLFAILYLGRSALGPFVVGLVLAYLLDIPVERMARIGLPRWLSVLIVYAVVVVVRSRPC